MSAPTISYAITVYEELPELQRLMAILRKHMDPGDEIVIQYDEPNTTPTVLDYLKGLGGSAVVVPFALNHDWAAFKNNISAHCRCDYIFQIDVDEYPADMLLMQLRPLLAANPQVDVLLVPRINIVHGITPEHVRKWNWQVNQQGWVNFPDPQTRIWRNRDSIYWEEKVHCHLVGGQIYENLPFVPEFSLMHPKTIARQESQNSYYETLLS